MAIAVVPDQGISSASSHIQYGVLVMAAPCCWSYAQLLFCVFNLAGAPNRDEGFAGIVNFFACSTLI
ncbi:hypothetical protein EON65_26395 [archaeon]|nr:MAG: hypothetical protein EON65_26395 [archaeon]